MKYAILKVRRSYMLAEGRCKMVEWHNMSPEGARNCIRQFLGKQWAVSLSLSLSLSVSLSLSLALSFFVCLSLSLALSLSNV